MYFLTFFQFYLYLQNVNLYQINKRYNHDTENIEPELFNCTFFFFVVPMIYKIP